MLMDFRLTLLQTVRWNSLVWRRGTVPLYWKNDLKANKLDAAFIILPDPYRNIEVYYKRLQERYGEDSPITLLNLLRFELSGEMLLSEVHSSKTRRDWTLM